MHYGSVAVAQDVGDAARVSPVGTAPRDPVFSGVRRLALAVLWSAAEDVAAVVPLVEAGSRVSEGRLCDAIEGARFLLGARSDELSAFWHVVAGLEVGELGRKYRLRERLEALERRLRIMREANARRLEAARIDGARAGLEEWRAKVRASRELARRRCAEANERRRLQARERRSRAS